MPIEHNGYFICSRGGVIDDNTRFYDWQLLKTFIGLDIYWHAHCFEYNDMPLGHRGYIVKMEGSDLDWLQRQASLLDAPIFVINGCINAGNFFEHTHNLHWLPWVEWHYQVNAALRDFKSDVTKQIIKKISALVNVSKPNKMIGLAAVKKYHADHSITSLHDDMHWRTFFHGQPNTGHAGFNCLLEDVERYASKKEFIDDFNLYPMPDSIMQKKVHDFHHAAYQCCAINVTNESFHQSDGCTEDGRSFVYPGPFLTEKTLKCLLGETALIANGQMQTYHALQTLGFVFDYGLDLSYDEILPDLDRLVGMTALIQSLQQLDAIEIFERTRLSCIQNKEHILSNRFYHICEKINEQSAQYIHNHI